MTNKSFTLSEDQLELLSYVVTRNEYATLTQKVQNLASGVGVHLKLPRVPPGQLGKDAPEQGQVSRSVIRLFAIVYTSAALYDLVIGIVKSRGKQLPQALKNAMLSMSSLRLAAFVSTYSAIYRLLLPRLTNLLPTLLPGSTWLKSHKLPPFLSAVAASPAMLLEPRGPRRVTLALYALTRAAHAGIGAAEHKIWPEDTTRERKLRQRQWWWGGHLIFAASNAILLHAFVYYPSTFPEAFSSFILRYSGAYLPARPASLASSHPWPSSRDVVDAVAHASRRHYPSYVSPLLYPAKGQAIETGWLEEPAMVKVLPITQELTHLAHQKLVCGILHPEQVECWDVFKNFSVNEFKSSSKFFGVLALLSMLVRYKSNLKSPETAVSSALSSTITSAASLSLSIGTAWSTICLFQHYLPNNFIPTKRFYLQGFLAGLWSYILPVQRATDLGMYTARMAIQTAWDVGVIQRKWRNRRNGEVLYFAAAMGVLMSIHETRPKVVKSRLVRSALARIAGQKSLKEEVKEEIKKNKD